MLVKDCCDDMRSAGSTYVFTSWSGTNKRIEGIIESRKITQYVSIVIDVEEGLSNRTVRLINKMWIKRIVLLERRNLLSCLSGVIHCPSKS
jgi:hypothetical protein